MDLAANIRWYRERANMYQSDLGKYLGVSAQAVSKWELGKTEPDRNSILKMCELFGITADELLGREAPTASTDPWNPDDYINDPDYDSIRIMARGMSKMSPENRQKLLDVAMTLFSDDFDEEGNRRDT